MKWCVCICENKQCQYFVTQCWKVLEGNKQQNPWKGTVVIQCRSIDSMKLQVSRSFQVTICSRVFRECASAPGFRYSPFFSVLWKWIGWGGVYFGLFTTWIHDASETPVWWSFTFFQHKWFLCMFLALWIYECQLFLPVVLGITWKTSRAWATRLTGSWFQPPRLDKQHSGEAFKMLHHADTKEVNTYHNHAGLDIRRFIVVLEMSLCINILLTLAEYSD